MTQTKILLILFLFPLTVASQPVSREDSLKNDWPTYLTIGAGVGMTSFRDKATSPLFYDGPGLSVNVNRIRTNACKEINLAFGMVGAANVAVVDERSVSTAIVSSFSAKYTRLYQLKKWSDHLWNYKAGGTLVTTANIRGNPSLQNNAFGYEGFVNLMGSFKVSRDVSRKTEQEKKFLFIRYTLMPRKQTLSYQLDVGLWNNSHRNGYAYIDQSSLINDWRLFEGYSFKTFSGVRFSAELNYTRYLIRAPNNAVQLSYSWDALQTPKGADAFAMSFHTIRFSLLYNTK